MTSRTPKRFCRKSSCELADESRCKLLLTTLLPLRYAHHFDCRRVLLVDYENAIGLHVQERSAIRGRRQISVATHQCYNPRGGEMYPLDVLHNPMNLGLRSSTAFLALCALNELGVLDYSVCSSFFPIGNFGEFTSARFRFLQRFDVPTQLRPRSLDVSFCCVYFNRSS